MKGVWYQHSMSFSGTIRSFYERPQKTYSLEFFPPKEAAGLAATKEVMARCAEYPIDFMTVTYGAGGTSHGLTDELLKYVKDELKKPVISHLTCVCHSKEEIDQRLEYLSSINVTSVLALRGDPPRGETSFKPHENGFSCARDLISHINSKRFFSLAAAGYPEGHKEAVSLDADVRYLKEKVDAGAEVIFTQLFFDTTYFYRFLERVQKANITVPVIPGIMPIRDPAQVKRFTQLCGATIPDTVLSTLEQFQHSKEAVMNYGTELALALCEDLLSQGAKGIHFYTLNKAEQVLALLKSLCAKR